MWSWSALYLDFSQMQLASTILVPTGERVLCNLFFLMFNVLMSSHALKSIFTLFLLLCQNFARWSWAPHPPQLCALWRKTSKMVSTYCLHVMLMQCYLAPLFLHIHRTQAFRCCCLKMCLRTVLNMSSLVFSSGLSSMKWCRRRNTTCAMWLLLNLPGWLSWLLTFTSRLR